MELSILHIRFSQKIFFKQPAAQEGAVVRPINPGAFWKNSIARKSIWQFYCMQLFD